MKTELILSLPTWAPSQILSEALKEHNLLHADNQLDEHSERPVLCGAVLAMLRHRTSNYNDMVTVDNRNQLRAEILAAARRQYCWLRPDLEPILTRTQVSCFEKRAGEKYLDCLSRLSVEFLAERSRTDLALRQNPDAHTRSELRTRLKKIDRTLGSIYGDLTHDQGAFNPDYAGLRRLIRTDHTPGQCNLDGLGAYRLEPAGVKCRRCGQAVLQTKTEVPVGQGKRDVVARAAIACRCWRLKRTKTCASALHRKSGTKKWQPYTLAPFRARASVAIS